MYNQIKKTLTDLGYKEFNSGLNISNCDYFFQKRITDDIGTKYFLNLRIFRIPDSNGIIVYSMQFDSQFTSGNKTINTTVFGDFNFEEDNTKNIQKINEYELEFHNIFKLMNYDYYSKYLN